MSGHENEIGTLRLVLDEASREALRAKAPPLFAGNEFYHHQTLRFGVPKAEVADWIGRTVSTTVYAVAWNKEVQAARVQASELPDENGVPHVTLTTAQGVKPYASVAMLEGDHHEQPLDMTLTGTLVFKPKNIPA
jgi:choline dehydrogenase-like flavoprotein